jgi:hypothetical protein
MNGSPLRRRKGQRINLLVAGLLTGCVLAVSGSVAAVGADEDDPTRVRVQSSVGYPFHVGEWDSYKVIVNFHQTFPTVSKVCLVASFEDAGLPGWTEYITADYKEEAGYTGAGEGDHFITITLVRPATRVRTCDAVAQQWSPLDPGRWRDGREVLYIEGGFLNDNDYGDATVTRIDALLYQ